MKSDSSMATFNVIHHRTHYDINYRCEEGGGAASSGSDLSTLVLDIFSDFSNTCTDKTVRVNICKNLPYMQYKSLKLLFSLYSKAYRCRTIIKTV